MHRLIAAGIFAACLAYGQTADEIIAKNIEARGGLAKLKSFKTIRTTARLNAGGFHAVYVSDVKRGGKVREEVILQGMAEVMAYDGKSGWRVSPFEGRKDPDTLSADDSKELVEDADIDGQLVDYKNKDHRAEFVGHDSVEGTDCYKIKLTMANGDVRYYYIDTDSYLELKIETERSIRGTVHYDEILYGDYDKVDGVYFPFSVEAGPKGSSMHQKLTVDKVEIDVPMADTRFAVPAAGGSK